MRNKMPLCLAKGDPIKGREKFGAEWKMKKKCNHLHRST